MAGQGGGVRERLCATEHLYVKIMSRKSKNNAIEKIEGLILMVRGQRVILDAALARLYGVSTKRLNEQVRRNIARFPNDFAFRLTPQEVTNLKSQNVTSSSGGNRSQFATGSQKHRDPRYPPMAFTEHGAIMAANVLNSAKAVEMSVFVVRAFVKMREQLLATATLEKRLAEIEKVLLTHDGALRDLYQKIRPLLLPPPEKPRKKIGFDIKEPRATYGKETKRTKKKK